MERMIMTLMRTKVNLQPINKRICWQLKSKSNSYKIPFLPYRILVAKWYHWICEFCDSQRPQSQKRCGTCKRWKGGKRSLSNKNVNQEQSVSNNKAKKRGRKSKTLPPIPAHEVEISLEVGVALVLGSATCSPLTGGVNANDSSIGPSIVMSSYVTIVCR